MRVKIIYLFILTALLTAALAIALNAAVTVEGILPFEDVKTSYWYADAVEFCYANGIVSGMNEYTFSASGQLTRAQFVTMLANVSGADGGYDVDVFTDVKKSHWYYNAVAWAVEQGITSGTSRSTFSPNAYITREQLSVMMTRYMNRMGYRVNVEDDALGRFRDIRDVTPYAVDGVKYMVSAGLISGMTENTVAPRATVTRAQAARIFMMYMKNYHYGGHTHYFTEASCTDPAICNSCGMKEGLALGHDVSDSFSCKSDYKTECGRCGQKIPSAAMPHDFAAANCGRAATCKRCSLTRGKPLGDHTWWAATCTNPKMCRVCYKTEGKALGHTTDNGMCTRCKTVNFTSDFQKTVYYLKTNGTYHSIYETYYVSDYYEFEDGDTLNALIEYDPVTDMIYLTYDYKFYEGTFDRLRIEIEEKSSAYRFTYTYSNGTVALFNGSGYLDPATYRNSTDNRFESYTGVYNSQIKENLDLSFESLLKLTHGSLDYLYGGTLKDLGFVLYDVND